MQTQPGQTRLPERRAWEHPGFPTAPTSPATASLVPVKACGDSTTSPRSTKRSFLAFQSTIAGSVWVDLLALPLGELITTSCSIHHSRQSEAQRGQLTCLRPHSSKRQSKKWDSGLCSAPYSALLHTTAGPGAPGSNPSSRSVAVGVLRVNPWEPRFHP